jgi:hypothetical protein
VTKDEKQAEKDQDLVKANGPPKASNQKKFSPKDLLPRGGGSHSIQKILANISQVYFKIYAHLDVITQIRT